MCVCAQACVSNVVHSLEHFLFHYVIHEITDPLKGGKCVRSLYRCLSMQCSSDTCSTLMQDINGTDAASGGT